MSEQGGSLSKEGWKKRLHSQIVNVLQWGIDTAKHEDASLEGWADNILQFFDEAYFELKAENAALLTRTEQAERERDEAKEVFELALREKGWAKGLTDAYAERDALRAEAGRLRDLLERMKLVGLGVFDAEIKEEISIALSSTPLSAAAVERWKAMERVVEAVRHYRDVPRQEEGFWNAEVWGAEARAWSELMGALAALDRTEEK